MAKVRRQFVAGERFGKLVVLSEAGVNPRRVLVHCDCGVERVMDYQTILCGGAVSCGCHRRANHHLINLRHGATCRVDGKRVRVPEYNTWTGMHKRCNDLNDPRYGGRGIRVCERWSGPDGYANFLADMGPRPSPQHSLDRYPDNDGPYATDNCRWATRIEQASNKHNNVLLTLDGKTQTVREWARELGCEPAALYYRAKAWGQGTECVATPVRRYRYLEIDGVRDTFAGWCRRRGLSFKTVSWRMQKMGMNAIEALSIRPLRRPLSVRINLLRSAA